MRALPLLLAASLVTAHAADITVSSTIRSVTVYADRAEVTREASLNLETGAHTLVFETLPTAIDLNSLRAEGTGAFTLLDIRSETVQTIDVEPGKVRELQERLVTLELGTEENRRAEARIETRRIALGKILDRLTTAGKDAPNPDLDPAKWSGMLDYHTSQHAQLDKDSMGLKTTARALQKEIDLVRRELASLQGSRQKVKQVARVNVDAKTAGSATLRLTYIVRGPSWSPAYDIRASVADKTLDVAYFANVRQATGEDWKDVTLRLSTAQPSIYGREPELEAWFIAKQELVALESPSAAPGTEYALQRRAVGREKMSQMIPAQIANAEMTAPVADAAAVSVVTSGVAAVFEVARKVDILTDNKSVRAPLDRSSFPAYFRHTCVPKYSPHVYLKAKAINKTDLPYLAGPSAIFVDGAFVANAEMEFVPAGQEFWTYLGVDASIKVERRLLADRTEVSGLIGVKTLSTTRDHLFKLSNGKTTPIELVIWDQLPIANHEDIKVTLNAPELKANDPDLKIDELKRLEWRIDLKAGEKRDVPFRFTVARPENLTVVGL